MLKDLGYDFESLYIGGGTPTIMLDELCKTIDLARDNFNIKEVSSETNPNHLVQAATSMQLKGRVQRLSVGVQSFDNGLLKQMDRYDKYGSAARKSSSASARRRPLFRLAQRGHDLQLPLADRGDPAFNDLEKLVEVGRTPDHVLAALRARPRRTRKMQSRRSGKHGLQPRVRATTSIHRRRAGRRRSPVLRARYHLDV